jgi:hypothetical protein
MSFLLTRIGRALAEPPKEAMTHALLTALNAHWKCLYDSDPQKWHVMTEHIQHIQAGMTIANAANDKHITFSLAAWEARRAAFQLKATLGGPSEKSPGPLRSSDWGTHWILFDWAPSQTGALVWGYRVERSADNCVFYPVEVCVENEVALLNQPQNQKFYYRVIPFNGFGDGPPSAIFAVTFDAELIPLRQKSSRAERP